MTITNKEEIDDLSAHLAYRLWENSSLRHGIFTPIEFRTRCFLTIQHALTLRHLNEHNEQP